MITYELAKKLKEAGFEQYTGDTCCHTSTKDLTANEVIENETVYYPTLSELREACGRGFGQLILSCNYENDIPVPIEWITVSGSVVCHGSTPEEAVANLYLAINS